MKTQSRPDETGKLRATIGIVTTIEMSNIEGVSYPLMLQGTELPAEATYVFPNATDRQSHKEIHLFFGDNKSTTKNAFLGRFILKCIPPAPKGPSQIKIKLSVSAHQELSIAVIDPASMECRRVGFVDFSMIEPPAIVPSPSGPSAAFSFNKIFTEFFGEDFLTEHRPRAGRDISHNLNISFYEALYGVQKHIQVFRYEICPTCAGSGVRAGIAPVRCAYCQGSGLQRQVKQTDLGNMISVTSCPTCDGTGQTDSSLCITCQGQTRIKSKCPLTINIPPGIDSGAQICLLNQAEPGHYGGRSGHLYVFVTVADHPLFTRIGRNISIHLPVRANFAKVGGQLQVPSVEEGSFFLLHLPPNTRDGAAFRVYGDESYTLNAIIDIYRPYNPIALLKIQKRLRAIKRALNYRDFEI